MIAVLRRAQDERVWRVLGMTAPLGQAVMAMVGWRWSGGDGVGWCLTEQGCGFWVSLRPGGHNEFMLTFPPLIDSRGDCCMTRRWAVAAVQARQRRARQLDDRPAQRLRRQQSQTEERHQRPQRQDEYHLVAEHLPNGLVRTRCGKSMDKALVHGPGHLPCSQCYKASNPAHKR